MGQPKLILSTSKVSIFSTAVTIKMWPVTHSAAAVSGCVMCYNYGCSMHNI